MKLTAFFGACLMALLLVGCSSENITPQTSLEIATKSPNEIAPTAQRCRPVKKESSLPFDAAVVNNIRLDGNCLYINVSYSGGCALHLFDLTWDGSVLESLPPQIPLRLHHESNDDPCEAWITQTIPYNVERLQLTGYNSVILRVIDPNGGIKTVLYAY